MQKSSFILIAILFYLPCKSQNQAPEISNLNAWADTSNSQLHVNFDAADLEGDNLEIQLHLSTNTTNYSIITNNVTGDIGSAIVPGTGKTITWDYNSGTYPNILNYKIRVTANDNQPTNIQEIVDRVDTNRLYYDLSWLQGIRDHTNGASHLQDVRDSIEQRLANYNLEITNQPFSFLGTSALNITGRIPGIVNDSITYINDAHYDGVSAGPAADDNGSGVVAFLEAARVLSDYQFANNIRFIGFDMEEDGLIGSQKYVNDGGIQPWETIAGVLNFEMIGYYSDKPNSQEFPNGFDILFPAAHDSMIAANWKGNFLANIANDGSQWLKETFDSCSRAFVPELRVISIQTPGTGVITQDLRRSDHAPFWDQGIQALMLSDGAEYRNENYHTANDVMDSLNFEFMGNNCKATIATLCIIAGIQHADAAICNIDDTQAISIHKKNKGKLTNSIWPNPTKHTLNIKFSDELLNKKTRIVITDKNGKIIKSIDDFKTNKNSLKIKLSDWKTGMYFVTTKTDLHTFTNRIIIY